MAPVAQKSMSASRFWRWRIKELKNDSQARQPVVALGHAGTGADCQEHIGMWHFVGRALIPRNPVSGPLSRFDYIVCSRFPSFSFICSDQCV